MMPDKRKGSFTANPVTEAAAKFERNVAKFSVMPGSLDASDIERLERIIARMDLNLTLLAAEPAMARAYYRLIETASRCQRQRLN